MQFVCNIVIAMLVCVVYNGKGSVFWWVCLIGFWGVISFSSLFDLLELILFVIPATVTGCFGLVG